MQLSSRRSLVFLIPLVLLLLPACSTETRPVDMVLIIDTSASMRGAGGTADIFEQVQASAQDIVGEVAPGSNVTVISYDSDTHSYPGVNVQDGVNRGRVNQLIGDLQANGQHTYTAKAIQDGLAEAARYEARDEGHVQVVVLLTDGLNDPPPAAGDQPLDFDEVVEPYAGKPWYVFHVQLGNAIDEDLRDALDEAFENTETIQDPEGANLDTLPEEVSRDWTQPVLKVTKWLGILIAAFILLVILIVVLVRVRSYARGKQLYGTLEYWRADEPGSKGKQDLAECGTSAGVGVGDIQLAGCGGDLCRLSTTREDGQWVVVAKVDDAAGADIRHKNRTYPELTLYSGDVFEIGDWNFRYRGDTGPRPR